ncbi:MAG: efflux RND transporter permease subunit [Planctomycetes bacterium]|nr:efflux RND transporter permease subunit [Planctomycetota bacterium]
MRLSETAIKRPVLATVANLLLIVLGLGALFGLPVRQYPDIDLPVVSINTTFPGASAAVMESDVSKRIEEAISGIEGVRTITTVSNDENSRIDVEFAITRTIEFATADVRDQLGRIRKQLPTGIDDPVIIKASSSSSPVLWIALQDPARNGLELTDYARRNLVDPLSVVSGVSRVQIGGERRYAMRIWLDPAAMAARNVSPADVVQRLNQENLELPSGRIESTQREMSVRTTTRLSGPEEFRALVVREGDSAGGQSGRVLLGDIAKVERGAANYRTGLRINGQPTIGLGIVKQSTANTLDVVDGVREAIVRLTPTLPPGLTLAYPYDESLFIKASISEVVHTLMIALALVVMVILVFLRSFLATLIPVLAIPVSLMAAAMVMGALGFSINVLTLLAMVLAIGLVVDDAIVVLENVYRRFEAGEPRLLAGVTGSREVAFAVIATTTVLIAVFVPISFQAGTVGRLQREFGLTLAATVAFSAFVALTLAPMLCTRLLRRSEHRNPIERGLGRALSGLEAGYGWLLERAMRARLMVALGGLAVIVAAVALYRATPQELSPTEDQGNVIIPLEAPQGATMEATLAHVAQVQAIIDPYMEDKGGPVRAVLSVTPAFGQPGTVNSAFVMLRLKPWEERTMTQQDLVKKLASGLSALPGARAFARNRPSFGIRDFGQSLSIVIKGEEYAQVQEWSRLLLARARKDPHFTGLRDDVDLTRPQLLVSVDRARASELGITAQDIGSALGAMLGEMKVTTYQDRGEQYDVVLQAPAEQRASPDVLERIYVRARASGRLVPLSTIASAVEAGAPKELRRVDRRPSVTISATLVDYSLGQGLAAFEEMARAELPPTAHLAFTGEAKEYKDATGTAFSVFGVALPTQLMIFALAGLIVFLVLAAQFESWIHPLIIIVGVPLAAAGGLAALLVTGQTLNVYSQIGLIMLIGLVAKNGILMVEFANQLRDRGEDIVPAMMHAARVRLRPILMTSIATIAGAVPLAMATGAGAEGRRAIGTVIIGGLSVATVLTLFVIPALYIYLARFTRPSGDIAREIARLEAEHTHR